MLDDGVNYVNAGLDQKAFGAAVFATMAWFAWRVTIYPCVEVSRSGLTVRQPFTTYEAPWPAVGTPDAMHGLRLPLAGQGVVTAWAFSPSMIADFSGDPSANRAVARIDRLRKKAARDGGTVKRRWSLGLSTLALTWAIAVTVAALASAV